MKSKTIKKFSSIMAAVAVFMLTLPAFASTQDEASLHYDDQAQENAIQAYNIMLDYFGHDESGFPIYPDNFGGAFYNGDHLVINTTASSSEMQAFYDELLAPYPVEVKQVAFSYNQLNTEGKAIAESLDTPLVRYGVNETENTFEIVLNIEALANSSTTTNISQQYTRANIPITYQVGHPTKLTASLIGGEGLYYERENLHYSFSLGICGTWKGLPAILTCGHAFKNMGKTIEKVNIYTNNGSKIGKLDSFSFGYDYGAQKAGDWAIILLDNSDLMTNKVYSDFKNNTYNITQKTLSVPVGVRLWGSGQYNRSYAGTVLANNETVIVDGMSNYSISGMTLSSLTTGSPRSGDSGGTNYYVSNGSNTFYGTLVGTSTEDDFFITSPYVWASNFTPKTN